mmetsp:Transcript_4622/g.11110  ORF Transcript_4622/g.11110 Transcript_4622/m.11110 type:complete len:409 (+) Transcript_4622:108-1334(+)
MGFTKQKGILFYDWIMLRFLFTIAFLVAFFGNHAAAARSLSLDAILESASPKVAVYSCFLTSDNQVDMDTEIHECCHGIAEVWQLDETTMNDRSKFELYLRCKQEIAQVPPSISNQEDTARFSWIVSKASSASTNQAEQHLWTIPLDVDSDEHDDVQKVVGMQKHPVHTLTPYHKTAYHDLPMVASKIDSHLGKDGGMHRLFHHRFEALENTDTYFLYLTIPTGMFIDLDDPIETTTGTLQSIGGEKINGVVDSDASHSFVVTGNDNDNDNTSSFRARLHAATVCDIEQPSFVSGQHLLVWEIDQIKGGAGVILEFATKLHLRYPHPSVNLEQWIDLPRPLLFYRSHHRSNTTTTQHDWNLEFTEQVWVAAGSDEDHNWIMGMTISFCLIGVGIMLRDVSRVSLWDDV